MLCYNYDEFTKQFLFACQADLNPEEPGQYLLPAHATFVPLPTNAQPHNWNQYRFDEAEHRWEINIDMLSAWRKLRAARNYRLAVSDWLFIVRDSPMLNEPSLERAWREYRQALRDLPASTDNPIAVVWPVEPSKNDTVA